MASSLHRSQDYQYYLANAVPDKVSRLDTLRPAAKALLEKTAQRTVSVSEIYNADETGAPKPGPKAEVAVPDTWNSVPAVLQRWFLQRMQAFDIFPGDQLKLTLNPWDVTHGLGLQSVTVAVERPRRFIGGIKRKPIDILFPDERKHPTIGFASPKILDGDHRLYRVQFSLAAGEAEEITAISPNGIFFGDGNYMGILEQNQTLLYQGPKQSVHTILAIDQNDKNRPLIVSEFQEEIRERVEGVYVCRFLKSA